MSLYALPNEIISRLPLYIDNIETFTNAASSCRLLRDNFSKARPSTILRLADASAPTFFSPHPHFLVAATARQASDWALGNAERTALLMKSFTGGIDGLYQFCLDHAGLTMDDIRRLHLSRFDIINPLSDKIDKMAGEQWYANEDFWDGGVSEPNTLYTDANRATFQILIYGELFGRGVEAILSPQRGLPFFDIDTRIEYIKYCVPDWLCQKGYPGFPVLQEGPYTSDNSAADQHTLSHIFQCKRWRRMWAAAFKMLSGNEEDERISESFWGEDWRVKVYRDALQCRGLEGMRLVTMPEERIPKECLDEAQRIREQIAMLKNPPESRIVSVRKHMVSLAVDPGQEVYICQIGGRIRFQ
ncbi:hypothetical protein ASPWEDRAFT_32903 [Aspergillus wentii DTO 134E9]|uniref:Uncharacterized protein n=1 Tax=Aspergillus wentii DTO 134E9 TaxID=1073089 RepID=A0A1L9R405_ASPWE|nr:uncharacterized protein ASPWEDRAFT_32903 [Aspergillus wentii DTO 134E9]KAI9926943.1 hypothetical protein MW887_003321 [Aspergillus wentii]OJJ29655.1 hypothetical protein ASPWEDRAFT_32903 [Aspergillus wentii DTO 134E9]